MTDIGKCAVIGCGFVGATSAFALMENGLFNEIVLIDLNQSKAKGEAMDLNHGMPFSRPARIYAGTYDDIRDCSLIIIAAGANQKPGETRLDLVHKNTAIFKSIIAEITARNTECILLVVTNPVDILTYVTLKLSGFPAGRVIGSGTVLDTARFKYLLGEHLEVDPRNVHAFIIGEHGDTELAVWSTANVAGTPVKDFCSLCGDCMNMQNMNSIFENVRTSAYKIIESKGATYYAVALAVERIAEAIIRDENSVLTVSSYIDGQFGLNDVCIGLPAVVGSQGVKRILDLPVNEEEKARLVHSAESLKAVIATLDL